LRPSVEKNQLPDACTIDGADAAEIENHFAAVLEEFTDYAREGRRLVAINDAALAVNDDDIATIASFQAELQLRLLRLYSEGSQVMRLRP
jgi:hypothetical protein